MKFAIVVSRYNTEITDGLLAGSIEYLKEKGVEPSLDDIFDAPGAFEIPLIAQSLARTKKYAGVICLGCVIKGDTAHFEFISLGASMGLMQASLATETPITFGILTTYTDEQAEIRAKNGAGNKGREAAQACYESVKVLNRILT
ncbi:MAG: 6,7-dimethyl-8-ribityllumazine synthase [Oligoflexia bacterium]|nr:6,7-dimethyl-8-ribityllumazine synthase [Oligoflexia bacterium]